MTKTFSPKTADVTHAWHLLDASTLVIGRLSTQTAVFLMGKHKPTFARHIDSGDHVVVINAAKIKVTGNKELQKIYHRHSGYSGGMRETTLEKMRADKPEEIVRHAVSGMLPKNKLQAVMLKRLHIYSDETHPYGQHFQ